MTLAVQRSSAKERIIILLMREREIRLVVAEALRGKFPDFHILSAEDGQRGMSMIEEHGGLVSLVLTETVLSKKTGWAIVNKYLKESRRPPFILLALNGLMDVQVSELERHGFGSLRTPRTPADVNENFVRYVRAILKNNQTRL